MSRKKPVPRRKRRTREHVLADLSANHVERHALLCGYSVERRVHDYGIDLTILTYDTDGNVENGQILVQLKATDHLKVIAEGQRFVTKLLAGRGHKWIERAPLVVVDPVQGPFRAVLEREHGAQHPLAIAARL